MNRNIIVENKVGAIGNLATEYTARAKPDGYTIYRAWRERGRAPTCISSSIRPIDASQGDHGRCDHQQAADHAGGDARQAVEDGRRTHRLPEGKEGEGDLRHLQSGRQGHGRDLQGTREARGGRGRLSHGGGLAQRFCERRASTTACSTISLPPSQERAGRLRILAVSTPQAAAGQPEYPDDDRTGHTDEPDRMVRGDGAVGDAASDRRPDQQDVQSRDGDARTPRSSSTMSPAIRGCSRRTRRRPSCWRRSRTGATTSASPRSNRRGRLFAETPSLPADMRLSEQDCPHSRRNLTAFCGVDV